MKTSGDRARRSQRQGALLAALACAAVAWGGVAGTASAYLNPPHVTPEEPIDADWVVIEVMYGFADGCWVEMNFVCSPMQGNHVAIDMWFYDGYAIGRASRGCGRALGGVTWRICPRGTTR